MSNNRILAGRDSRAQIGLNCIKSLPLTPQWGQGSRAVIKLPFISEGFKETVNYKEASALVGAKTAERMDIMSKSVDGSLSMNFDPEIAPLMCFLMLGRELGVTMLASGRYRHTFVPIGSGRQQSMPGFTLEIDRLMEKVRYPSNKVSTASFKADPEDYLIVDINGNGHSEEKDKVVARSLTTHGAGSANTFILGAGVIPADDDFIGMFLYVPSTESEYRITDTVALTGTVTVAETIPAGERAADLPLEVRAVGMTPGLDLSDLPYYRFLNGSMSLGLRRAAYESAGSGANTNTIPNVPTSVTGGINHELYVSVLRADADTGLTYRKVFKYLGAAITRSTTTISFATTPTGTDDVPVISSDAGDANWLAMEQIEGEIMSIGIDIDNGMKSGEFVMNGEPYQIEVQPQGRSFKINADIKYGDRFVELRNEVSSPEDLVGRTVSIKLIFESTAEYAAGYRHRLVIFMPNVYITEPSANIGGPDEPAASINGVATEQGGLEAIYLIVDNAQANDVITQYAPVAV